MTLIAFHILCLQRYWQKGRWIFCLHKIRSIKLAPQQSWDRPRSSENAVLSESYKAFIIDLHFAASSGLQLKNRLSLRRSMTGALQDLRAAGMRVIPCNIAMTAVSMSIGLESSQHNVVR